MAQPTGVGLIGLTGVGKTTVARYLRERHGFQVCTTGTMCRWVSQNVFGDQAQPHLRQIAGALKTIDPDIFLKAAVRSIDPARPVVIDSLRFGPDVQFARSRGFQVVNVLAPAERRRQWLFERGESFDLVDDDDHASPREISEAAVDNILENIGSTEELTTRIDSLILTNGGYAR